MGKIESGKLLYHLTKLSNLDSIIENGLVSRKILKENNKVFSDIADPAIMDKRKEFGLDKYIPFHFHPYSSFDVAVKNTYNDEFIYICLQRSWAKDNKFYILPMHPLSTTDVKICNYDNGIAEIDWNAMESSSTISEHCKNVRMAECLTELPLHIKDFHSIAVRTLEIKKIIEEKLEKIKGKKPYINVQPWLTVE